ncbi:MAG: hypothetical protein KBC64_04370 [Simkaniaceae bacterium]|nr:hypothetical protein [Simkaniaceae bacterium]
MANTLIDHLATGVWSIACIGDVSVSCRSRKEPQDIFNLPSARIQYPLLSLLSNSAGLIDSLGIKTLFFSGLRHFTGSILYIISLVTNIKKIEYLQKGVKLEARLCLNGESPAKDRMIVPYMGILFSISMIAFSILGLTAAFGFAVSGSLMTGMGIIAAITYGAEIGLKKLFSTQDSFGSQLLLS